MATTEERLDKIERILESVLRSDFSLPDRFNEHAHNGQDSKKIPFGNLTVTPNDAINAPSGGSTVDSEARTAINAIITELENRNFVKDN